MHTRSRLCVFVEWYCHGAPPPSLCHCCTVIFIIVSYNMYSVPIHACRDSQPKRHFFSSNSYYYNAYVILFFAQAQWIAATNRSPRIFSRAQTHRVECSGKLWNKNHTRISYHILQYTYTLLLMMLLVGDKDINGRVFIELNCIRRRTTGTDLRQWVPIYIVILYLLYIMYGAFVYNSAYYIIYAVHNILFTRIIIIFIFYYTRSSKCVPIRAAIIIYFPYKRHDDVMLCGGGGLRCTESSIQQRDAYRHLKCLYNILCLYIQYNTRYITCIGNVYTV